VRLVQRLHCSKKVCLCGGKKGKQTERERERERERGGGEREREREARFLCVFNVMN
jgi:hypothetical protein